MKGHRRAEPFRPHLAAKTLAISFMVVAEMYEGAARANWGLKKLARLDAVLRSYLVIPSSPEICRQWGAVRARRRRQPISHEDAWMAAAALAYSCPLATDNAQDFQGIPGLQLITSAPQNAGRS